MNPESGRLHLDDSPLKKIFKEPETVQQVFDRAMAKFEEQTKFQPALPPHWPRFQIGEIIHFKGHGWELIRIDTDLETQESHMVLKFRPPKKAK